MCLTGERREVNRADLLFTHNRDGGGTIDASEVTEMLKGLFSMARVSH